MQSEMPSKKGGNLSHVRIAQWLGTLTSDNCRCETFQVEELVGIPLPQDKYFKHGVKPQ